MRHIVILDTRTGDVLHTEPLKPNRDISNACAEAYRRGTVWGKGESFQDALHNAHMKVPKAQRELWMR